MRNAVRFVGCSVKFFSLFQKNPKKKNLNTLFLNMLRSIAMLFLLILMQSIVSVVPNECAKRGYVYSIPQVVGNYAEYNFDVSNGPCTSPKS